jgi:uncharacterized protein (AIM24 family)
MSATIIQGHRALKVLPSNDADIPFPAVAQAGVNTSVVASQLVDTAATFVTNSVRTGDIVYNTTDGTAATVVSVTNQTTLVLNANIFLATAKSYVVYQASAQTTIGNQGCVLYIGGPGNVAVTTNGGDTVTLVGLNAGQFVPVQVTKVALTGTSATDIIALW